MRFLFNWLSGAAREFRESFSPPPQAFCAYRCGQPPSSFSAWKSAQSPRSVQSRLPDMRFQHRGHDISSSGERSYHRAGVRSEEHTSELQSLMRISYAVFCLKNKKIINNIKMLQST